MNVREGGDHGHYNDFPVFFSKPLEEYILLTFFFSVGQSPVTYATHLCVTARVATVESNLGIRSIIDGGLLITEKESE